MNIYILNTLALGTDTIKILKRDLSIKGIIGLSDRNAGDQISDFFYQKNYCEENGFEFIEVNSYSLQDEDDRRKLQNTDIDLIIITGWQRLVPGWLINHCRIGIIGSHGSPYGITGGRGRSPQNWALLLGKREFYISIFKVDPGIDSGDIIDTQRYELTIFDDIKTSYYKVCLLTAQMIVKNVKNGFGKSHLVHQDDEAFYLPRRQPSDGAIDWSRSAMDIYNFVRALTRPYPGAFTTLRGNIIKVWSVKPMAFPTENKYQDGEVVMIFNKKDILVKVSDDFLLLEDYTVEGDLAVEEGDVFTSVNFKKQVNEIVERHYAAYPSLTVIEDLTSIIQ
jgi:methionyl-tRNA formyltransferase